jgi:hypothetical protein
MPSAGPPPLHRNIGYTATLGGLNGISRTSPTPTQHWVHRNLGRPQWHQPDLPHSNATLGTLQLWEASMASAGPPPLQRNVGYTATSGGLNGISRTSPHSNATLGTPQLWEASMASAGPPALQRNNWVHRNLGRPQWHQPDLPHSTATLGTPQLWEASMASAGPPPLQRNIGYTATLGGLNGISRTSPTPTQHWVQRNSGRPQRLQPDLPHSNSTLCTPQLWEASMVGAPSGLSRAGPPHTPYVLHGTGSLSEFRSNE